ncbi:unnamed protein product [Trifolium pratense]|uniref:Uncharacterized protein n=1 Tax=Trifolium pratense TaxID=57577 RepID=A0ACB0JTX0_TRIPR|nr:unnamed protein product [Trifolium pratense]
MKVNMDGSVTNLPPSAACGGVFRDHLVTFQGCFATPYQFYMRTLWPSSWPYRLAHNNGWQNVWIESDSQAALCTFGNHACSRAFEPTDGRTRNNNNPCSSLLHRLSVLLAAIHLRPEQSPLLHSHALLLYSHFAVST